MFITQFDKKYVKWGEILIKAHAKYYPNERIFVSAVNLDAEDILFLKSTHPHLILENQKISIEQIPEVKTRVMWGGQVGRHFPEMMACRKGQVLQDAFVKFPNEESFIMTDADIFINKNCNFEELLRDVDAALLVGGDDGFRSKPVTEVMSGVMILKNNQKCRKLVDLWVENMSKYQTIAGIKQWEWFWDQITLNFAVREIQSDGFALKNLPHKQFVNSHNNDEAYMWSAHSGSPIDKERLYVHWKKKIDELFEGE